MAKTFFKRANLGKKPVAVANSTERKWQNKFAKLDGKAVRVSKGGSKRKVRPL